MKCRSKFQLVSLYHIQHKIKAKKIIIIIAVVHTASNKTRATIFSTFSLLKICVRATLCSTDLFFVCHIITTVNSYLIHIVCWAHKNIGEVIEISRKKKLTCWTIFEQTFASTWKEKKISIESKAIVHTAFQDSSRSAYRTHKKKQK